MSGQLLLSNSEGRVIDQRRDHLKYVVKVCVWTDASAEIAWIATAAWDAKVHLYRISLSTGKTPTLPAPSATITLATNPESLLFVRHPESTQPILIATRRDSTFLFYYTADAEARLLGRQNLAPHSNAWIAFTPSAIALSPTDESLLAVATSAIPHMKLIIVRMMIPPISTTPSMAEEPGSGSLTAASQARAELALQDRESAAIQIQCTTMAPQTAYSTPALVWRPNGTGVWVNSDDGVIRGIETSSGKIVKTLKGHEPGSKIRCLCAAIVEAEPGVREEWLVSGGFDQKLIVWKPEKA